MVHDGFVKAWYRAGVACSVVAWVLAIVAQQVKGDYLPPEISVSQYGVGQNGWIFSLWMLAVVAAPLCLHRFRPSGLRSAAVLLWLAAAGAVVMAVVRTDPTGLQISLESRIHTAGAVVAIAALPIGISLALTRAAPVWRWTAWILTAVGAVCMILLLFAAFGVDTAGIGPAASWALWQSGGTVADMSLLVVYALGARTIPALDPTTLPPRQHRFSGTGHTRSSATP